MTRGQDDYDGADRAIGHIGQRTLRIDRLVNPMPKSYEGILVADGLAV